MLVPLRDGEEVGADIRPERTLQGAMQLSAVEMVQHLRRGDENDAPVGLAGAVRERPGAEGPRNQKLNTRPTPTN
jgi:hypothetical protein